MTTPRTSPDSEPPSLPHDPASLQRVLERVRALEDRYIRHDVPSPGAVTYAQACCNAAMELLPGAEVVWLDTQCVPNPPPLMAGISMVRHFEGWT